MDLKTIPTRGNGISDLLLTAGMDPLHVRRDRAFGSQWGWTDGRLVFATVWLDEVQDPQGVPKWSMAQPENRHELTRVRRAHAQKLWNMLLSRDGQSVQVVLQTKKVDRTKWKTGITERRGLDPEPWYVVAEPGAILLQRGTLPGRTAVSVDGKPMPPREPSWSLRETRPEQARFRERVGNKTGRRCALTGAPWSCATPRISLGRIGEPTMTRTTVCCCVAICTLRWISTGCRSTKRAGSKSANS